MDIQLLSGREVSSSPVAKGREYEKEPFRFEEHHLLIMEADCYCSGIPQVAPDPLTGRGDRITGLRD